MKLVIATRNKHKLEEIRVVWAGVGCRVSGGELVSALEFPGIPDVVEDGETFEANAVKKAVSLAAATGLWSLADDSGLEVDALGGAPGVYSARYAGEPVSYPANNRKRLNELQNTKNRAARFRCVIALSSPGGEASTVEGRCEGVIAYEERGQKGFGYDPLFVPEGFAQTFAEMGNELKNRLSQRGRALALAKEKWGALIASSAAGFPR